MHLFGFIMHFFMLCLEKPELFIELFVIYPPFGLVYIEHAYIRQKQICGKARGDGQALIEPVAKI